MCSGRGRMDAPLEMGRLRITYEDVKAAADENGRSVVGFSTSSSAPLPRIAASMQPSTRRPPRPEDHCRISTNGVPSSRPMAHIPRDDHAARGGRQDPACCSGPELNARIAAFFDRRTELHCGAQGAFPPVSPVSRSLLKALGPDAESRPTILELGSGTGGLAAGLLERGAAHVTGVDLSPASLAAARDRLAAAGLPDRRATFIVGDAADAVVEPHDWVVVDRAICCYADADRLMSRAIASARTRIAYSVPESDGWRRIVHRAIWWVEDSWQTLRRRRPSPGYWHSIRRIDAQLAAAGFSPTQRWRFRMWRLAIFDRAGTEVLVGARGFEPPTSSSRTMRAT
jgi:SAM-dependent methyltransferase